ncbi:unnamed protein product [Danaus chrysippus]|uniref:(African queen) hypothetical protein n=1 Tax=Danaus chrysippus TaxID=151541 RepID=A0A8J2W6F3_9NEOP|nr:unnamed protein product [Danaus chrysippus]
MTNRNFDNYILIPFLHFDSGPPLISSSPQGLADLVSVIEVSEGYDCQENSLTAIQKALEVSKPRSTIFVFTDAEAQDPHKLYDIQNLCEYTQSQVIRVGEALFGEYIADISCQGATMFTFYRKKEVKFRYGFSPLQPKSLRETTRLPIPGVINYLLISLPENNLDLVSIQLKMTDEYNHRNIDHRVIDESRKLYAATILIEPMKTFRVLVKCRDINNQEISGTSEQTQPQRLVLNSQSIAPEAKILEVDPLIDFGSSYSLACKVNSYPKPDIWWEDSRGEKLLSESALLEIPHVYISYLKIENASKNDTITCKCKNTEGEDAVSANIYVNRTFTFDVIQTPSDITVEYGTEGKLFCEANTYPESEVKWYLNDTLIEDLEEIDILEDEHMLLIKNMNLNYTGTYSCEISNSEETRTFSANVYISGLETPQIDLGHSEIVLKPGEETEQECTIIKGKPFPEISWKYKSSYDNIDLSNVPDGVEIHGAALKIDSADLYHSGFYVCEAINILGTDTQQIAVKIQYPPKIRNGDEEKIVRYGEIVELTCEVDAVPTASVRWDMEQDDITIPFDARHSTNDRNTHRFTANAKDSGLYICTAQNDLGTATRRVKVNVLVAPYIEALEFNTLTSRRGSTVNLSCKIILGNPLPSIKWVYIAPNLNTTELIREHSADKLDLLLEDITTKHEGSYQCIAENDVAVDSIKVSLTVI